MERGDGDEDCCGKRRRMDLMTDQTANPPRLPLIYSLLLDVRAAQWIVIVPRLIMVFDTNELLEEKRRCGEEIGLCSVGCNG